MRIATGSAVAHIWPKIPDGSRSSYGVTPAPGTQIPAPDAYTRAPDQAKFAVLTLVLEDIDAVHVLAAKGADHLQRRPGAIRE